jgi:hypothetical protein
LAVAHGKNSDFLERLLPPNRSGRLGHVDEKDELIAGDNWPIDADFVDVVGSRPDGDVAMPHQPPAYRVTGLDVGDACCTVELGTGAMMA